MRAGDFAPSELEIPAIPVRGEVYDRTAHYPRSVLVSRKFQERGESPVSPNEGLGVMDVEGEKVDDSDVDGNSTFKVDEPPGRHGAEHRVAQFGAWRTQGFHRRRIENSTAIRTCPTEIGAPSVSAAADVTLTTVGQ